MLEELKNLNYLGGKDGLLFFMCDVIGHNEIRIRDAEVICSHAPGKRHLSVEDLIDYCHAFDWINVEKDALSLSPSISAFTCDKDILNKELIVSTVNRLFEEDVFNPSLFSYDVVQSCYSFKNELLPLSFATIRNVLNSQGFIVKIREPQGNKFYINSLYDGLIAEHCKSKRKQLSLKQLRERLLDEELAGEKAELYVLDYECKRIGPSLSDRIKRISEIDVTAGYDIVSFESAHSQEPNRFIEVKAVSSVGFFWSNNEYEMAKLKGEMYYLYLVELGRISEPDYKPEIIKNPASCIMESDKWLVEAESYHIKRVNKG